jgi:hypothetical protein
MLTLRNELCFQGSNMAPAYLLCVQVVTGNAEKIQPKLWALE